jgi:hypothetical protein
MDAVDAGVNKVSGRFRLASTLYYLTIEIDGDQIAPSAGRRR